MQCHGVTFKLAVPVTVTVRCRSDLTRKLVSPAVTVQCYGVMFKLAVPVTVTVRCRSDLTRKLVRRIMIDPNRANFTASPTVT